jgi:hypothetical protein
MTDTEKIKALILINEVQRFSPKGNSWERKQELIQLIDRMWTIINDGNPIS